MPHHTPTLPSWVRSAAALGSAALVAAGCARGRARPGTPAPPGPAVDAERAGVAGARPTVPADPSAIPAETGRRIARDHRVAALRTRRFTHAALWAALAPATRTLRVREVGRSVEGRPIRAVTFGGGRTTVLLWSQMHGNESTATMALADLLAWFADPASQADPLRARLAAALTVVAVPMLNPDGAERFRRENAQGVDVNRDALRLATPEARALRALRDSIRPAFGFNLHDQRARPATGGRSVAVALLAPAADAEGGYDPTRAAARLVAAGVAAVLEREVPGRVAKYDETYEPRAFGELMQRLGTSTVLVESGALPGDPEKQRLRALNVVALLAALDAIATGHYRQADPRAYDRLPGNGRVYGGG